MGMDLSGEGGHFRFSQDAWGAALELAREHGWEPAATEPPEEFVVYAPDGVTVHEEATQQERKAWEGWDGSYLYNSRQVVTDEDAANIAASLERALEDIPEEGGATDKLLTPEQYQRMHRSELPHEEFDEALEGFVERQRERKRGGITQIRPQTPANYFAGQKDWLREFITFCRAGGFSVG
jgi:hypothetical protein